MKKWLSILFLVITLVQQSNAQQETVHCSKAAAYKNSKGMRTSVSLEILGLMDQYDVNYYKLDIAAERTTNAISGNTTIQATVVQGTLSSFVFELSGDMIIDSLRFNGQLQSFTRTDSFVTVSLATPLPTGSSIQSIIYYTGTPSGGLFNGIEPFHNNPLTYTLSEPFSSYHWFAVKQILTDKADSVEVWITTSDDNKAGSNGLLKNTIVLPGNKNRYEWKSNYPIAYYLISFSVAQYMDYTLYAHPTGASQPVPVVNYIYDSPEALAYFQTEVDKTPRMIETFSDMFGLYPFSEEKYGHCTAPIGGGMEHQTMTTVNDFFTGLTAHELAHQWFGDHVTCGTWHDIWLNEGFASYCEYLYHQTDLVSNAQSWLSTANSAALSSPSGSVYVDDTTNVGRIFDGNLTYKKGGLLLHMLRHEINNDALFFQGMKNYQQSFAYKTATQVDFKQVMESTTGMNFATFFNQWYFGSGYPILSATWNHTSDGSFYLKTTQVGSDPSITPIYATTLDVLIQRSDAADTLIRIFIDQSSNGFAIPHVAGTITNILLDPNEWLLNTVDQVTYDPSLIITAVVNPEISKDIKLFPNPASSVIQLSLPDNYFDTAKLYDAWGQLLQTFILEGESFVFPIHTLKSGVYFIILQEGKRTLTFIKE